MTDMKENKGQEQQNIHGIKIQHFNYIMMVLTCIIYVVLLSITIKVYKIHDASSQSTQNYILCEQLAEQLRQGSDYLTEQVRLFAETGELRYAEAYFEEANGTRRRDLALEKFMEINADEELESEFSKALSFSNELMEIEYYSMRLTAEAYNLSDPVLPKKLQEIKLSPEDAALSPQQKEEKGRLLVFDNTYREYKEKIYSHLNVLINAILSQNEQFMNNDASLLSTTLGKQRIMITLLFIMNLIMFSFIILMVVRPLKIYISNIQQEKLFDIIGSYEFKYLALTYNNIYEINAANKAKLRYSSEHDKPTGIYNRTVFENSTKLLKDAPVPLALIIMDIDHFKNVNDTHGHGTGDAVIRKVGQLLQRSFRVEDTVIRYGGDEFIVIMTSIKKENQDIISNKAAKINKILSNPDDGLPAVTLSFGIAFSENGYSEELFSNADKALYQAKNEGRSAWHFAE